MRKFLSVLFFMLAAQVLVSCTPEFNLALYNQTGQQLVVMGSRSTRIVWDNQKYLTIPNRDSGVLLVDYPNIELRILDQQNSEYVYLIERFGSEAFRSVSAGDAPIGQPNAEVTDEAQRACIHLSIEADLKLYFRGSTCGVHPLDSDSIADQPPGFPVLPVRVP